jgi:hypothetical protein
MQELPALLEGGLELPLLQLGRIYRRGGPVIAYYRDSLDAGVYSYVTMLTYYQSRPLNRSDYILGRYAIVFHSGLPRSPRLRPPGYAVIWHKDPNLPGLLGSPPTGPDCAGLRGVTHQ